jgi:FemAB-related protein (PEP-CTERM system-associated)
MSVQVKRYDEHHRDAWEHYVAQHPQGTFFHTLTWADGVEEAFGHRQRYLTAWQGDRLVGVFPLTQIQSRLAGCLLVSVPYAIYGGVLADDENALQALLAYAQRLADRLKAQWIDIRSIEQQWPDLPVIRRYVTFRKHLPDDPGKVLPNLPRKARAAARHARNRYELTATFDDEDLNQAWSLYSQSMHRLGSINYPTSFFRSLIKRTGKASQKTNEARHLVQLVWHRDEPIAGLVSFIYKDTLMPYFAGCDRRFEKYHPNNFMYLAAMEEGVRLGCKSFDFGRSRIDNTGAFNFKRFQGFEPTPLHYQYYVPRGGRTPDLQPGNPRLALARRVWPKLPLAVTRPLGAWLAKSIPG